MLLDLPLNARVVVDQAYDMMLARRAYTEEPWSAVDDVGDFLGKAYYNAVIMRLFDEHGEVTEERVPATSLRWGDTSRAIQKRIPSKRNAPVTAPAWTTASNTTNSGYISYAASDLFHANDDLALQDVVATLALAADPDVLKALRCDSDHPRIAVLCLVYAPVRSRESQNYMIQQQHALNKQIAYTYAVDPSGKAFKTHSFGSTV